MSAKKPVEGQPVPRKKYTSAFKAECVRQVAAGARQADGARAQGISPALLSRWQRQALEQAVPSSAELDEIKRPRTTQADPAAVLAANRLLGLQLYLTL